MFDHILVLVVLSARGGFDVTRWPCGSAAPSSAVYGTTPLPILQDLSRDELGASLAVIGAVVGEFVASNRGLGYVLKQGQQLYDTALAFVGIGTLVVLARALYGIVALAERVLLR